MDVLSGKESELRFEVVVLLLLLGRSGLLVNEKLNSADFGVEVGVSFDIIEVCSLFGEVKGK